ncbi:hypothetical protein CTheo_298 [Ceratobasidium theobromae]|uniref:Glutathione S-transferase 3, mitochondrial n=1 Tax=Ceratobasidium theobromae TaxID=1582974 RepID=A0A5N5QXK8_9AGAM|nr:hypothetical protein CTheo_298 [Ceratobasidium theobromae]
MTVAITVPDNYGYVVLAALSTGFLTAFQTTLVSQNRKKAGIHFPQLYAEKAEVHKSFDAMKFNCAQRAHANTLEFLPHVLFFTSFLGLRRPVLAASLGAAWTVGRIFYTLGYVTGDPKKRNTRGGFIGSIVYWGLLLSATHAGVELAISGW